MCGCLSCVPYWEPGPQPGMCPKWELNQQPFSLQASVQSTEPHQSGPRKVFHVLLWQDMMKEMEQSHNAVLNESFRHTFLVIILLWASYLVTMWQWSEQQWRAFQNLRNEKECCPLKLNLTAQHIWEASKMSPKDLGPRTAIVKVNESIFRGELVF